MNHFTGTIPHPPPPPPPGRSGSYQVYKTVDECCQHALGRTGCVSPQRAAALSRPPELCYVGDQYWPDRTCKITSGSVCGKLYPDTQVFRTGKECCSKVHMSGCKASSTICKIPNSTKRTCVDGTAKECRRGWGVYGTYESCCEKEFGKLGCRDPDDR